MTLKHKIGILFIFTIHDSKFDTRCKRVATNCEKVKSIEEDKKTKTLSLAMFFFILF